jgi:hypothetical protein
MMRHHPKRSYPMLDLAKLPRPGNDSTAANNGLNPIGGAIFFDELFSGKFGKSVERSRSC